LVELASICVARLALIIVLDQFSRSMYRGTVRAYVQDRKALEGIEFGHYAAVYTPWQKTFFFLPLGHSAELAHLQTAVGLAEELVGQAPAELRRASSTRRRRPVATATSSRASGAILIGTQSWAGNPPWRNWTTWPAGSAEATGTLLRIRFEPDGVPCAPYGDPHAFGSRVRRTEIRERSRHSRLRLLSKK
jgi:hypothetical protein